MDVSSVEKSSPTSKLLSTLEHFGSNLSTRSYSLRHNQSILARTLDWVLPVWKGLLHRLLALRVHTARGHHLAQGRIGIRKRNLLVLSHRDRHCRLGTVGLHERGGYALLA